MPVDRTASLTPQSWASAQASYYASAARKTRKSVFGAAVDLLVAQGGTETLTSEKCLKAQALAAKRVQVAYKTLQTARAISRAAVAGPLRLFGSRSQAAAPAAATG